MHDSYGGDWGGTFWKDIGRMTEQILAWNEWVLKIRFWCLNVRAANHWDVRRVAGWPTFKYLTKMFDRLGHFPAVQRIARQPEPYLVPLFAFSKGKQNPSLAGLNYRRSTVQRGVKQTDVLSPASITARFSNYRHLIYLPVAATYLNQKAKHRVQTMSLKTCPNALHLKHENPKTSLEVLTLTDCSRALPFFTTQWWQWGIVQSCQAGAATCTSIKQMPQPLSVQSLPSKRYQRKFCTCHPDFHPVVKKCAL